MLVSFINMRLFGFSANLMSLGAIDFGMIVDGAVVMMESSIHRLEERRPNESGLDAIRTAAHDVARPMTFGVVIIMAVYMPIFFLQGLEGRMFRPMAFTVCSALAGALLLALIAIPVFTLFAFGNGLPARRSSNKYDCLGKLTGNSKRGRPFGIRHSIATVSRVGRCLAIP